MRQSRINIKLVSIDAAKNFQLKRMILGGILKGEIKGGFKTISNAERAFQNYMYDYNLSSPAIPYQLLITDRLQQPDSSQWITELYFPVFNTER